MTEGFWNSDSGDIAKAISEYPELPVYFDIPNDEIAGDYSFTLHERHRVEVCKIWEYNEQLFFDKGELIEQMADDVYDEGELESSGECHSEAAIRFEKLPVRECILIHTSA